METTGWKLTKKEAAKNRRLKKLYGIDFYIYCAMLQEQDFCCAICRRKFRVHTKKTKFRPQVDHCHTTLKVRGLLCYYCNYTIVPFFEKSAHRMQHLTNYLTRDKDYRNG